LRNGFYTRSSPDFYNLTGRRPATYKEYLTQKGPHGGTGLEELFSATGSIYTKGVDQFANLANVKKDADAKKSGSNAPPALKLNAEPPSLYAHSLYETLLQRGAHFKPEMPTTDMQYPTYFDPAGTVKWDPKQTSHHEWHDLVMAEMANTAANAGIIHDVYSKIFITGPKAKEFLTRIATCVIAKNVGDVRMGYVLRRDGQLMNEATIGTRGENDYYYCGQLGHGAYEMNLLPPLREELGYTAEEVVIENASQHYELIHVAGPKCKEILAEVMGQEVVDVPVFKFKNLTIDGIPMEVFRMSFTGMVGYEFHRAQGERIPD
jgi:glycine cleavage system aminomethyltransferase T